MLYETFSQVQALVIALNNWLAQAFNGNSMVAGAVTASLIAPVFYVVRKVPKRIWSVIERYTFFTYDIEYNLGEAKSMIGVIASKLEYELQKRVSKTRPAARLVTRHRRIVESLADGGFFFFYQGACLYVSRQKEGDKNSGPGKKEDAVSFMDPRVTLSIKTLRIHRPKILALLNENAKEYTVPGVHQVCETRWSSTRIRMMRMRNFTYLPNLAIDLAIKKRIDEAIDHFLAHREENNRKDRPHKLIFMLHGEPGTGKSALAEYIAFRLKTSLFCVNGTTTDGPTKSVELTEIINSARDNISDEEVPVVLLDDFDTFWTGLTKRDKKISSKATEREKRDEEDEVSESKASLGKLLTSLQSPVEITDCVVVFTTNHLEKIDPAVYRPGRVNVLLEIGRMTPRSVMEYFQMCYGIQWPEHTVIERAFRACDVSSFFDSNQDDPQGFIEAVTSNKAADDELFRSVKKLTAPTIS